MDPRAHRPCRQLELAGPKIGTLRKPERPLEIMSWVLSRLVPRNRWSGRTQGGLSHRWSTHRPTDIGPFAISHERRCAEMFLGRKVAEPRVKMPYPRRALAPRHSQHPSPLMTFAQNLSSIVVLCTSPMIGRF